MTQLDTAAKAQLDQEVINPIWFAYLDFLGDPARANSSGGDITLAGTNQPDLDGTYVGIDARFVDVSGVKSSSGGSETVTIRMSGIRGLDDADKAMLADAVNWQGRTVRMWQMIRNVDLIQQGAIRHYYTGYMMSLGYQGNEDSTTIEISIESYLAAFAAASNRSYLGQADYDPGDLSAKAAVAIANGNSSTNLTGGASNRPWDGAGGVLGAAGWAIGNGWRPF